jgi:hypothetical protein
LPGDHPRPDGGLTLENEDGYPTGNAKGTRVPVASDQCLHRAHKSSRRFQSPRYFEQLPLLRHTDDFNEFKQLTARNQELGEQRVSPHQQPLYKKPLCAVCTIDRKDR